MQAPKLLIRKAMMNIQGKTKPCVQVQAVVDEKMQALLTEYFLNENLFKRSMYQSGLPAGAPAPGPSLAPHLSNLIKNDACPELTVKSILGGQLYQASSIWEIMAFEYIAMRSFDSLAELMMSARALGTETQYMSPALDMATFASDTALEKAAAAAEAAETAAAVAAAELATPLEPIANAA